ncbi:MAG TPA: site-2 protease family protein [Candidatus Dormibacteraeota bacterium]|nr:site-2 protease family protein [Candidatus Dormibacteraeota bacterium]
MTQTIRLGKLLGIEIGVNWSLIFIFALIAWTLGSATLPAEVPGQRPAAYWVAALAGAVLFYGCLLAHELAHALMARRQGLRVAGITLWLFGGVSQLEGEPKSPGAEALITLVGPLTSFAVAGIAFLLELAASALALPALVSVLLAWLALLNVALGLFNLIPAFPLDGGRLLGSLFWWRTGTRLRGVHRAVLVGRVFAFLMIGFGLLELFRGDVVDGIWIAFIGWFLLSAASAEESAATTRSMLRSVPVSAAMTSPVVTVPDWLTVEQLIGSVAPRYRFSTYPLHDPSGKLTGVARLGELLRTASSAGSQRRLHEVSHPISEVPTAHPDEDLEHLVQRLGSALQDRVLVFDGDQLVGILSPSDVGRVAARRQALAGRGGVR